MFAADLAGLSRVTQLDAAGQRSRYAPLASWGVHGDFLAGPPEVLICESTFGATRRFSRNKRRDAIFRMHGIRP